MLGGFLVLCWVSTMLGGFLVLCWLYLYPYKHSSVSVAFPLRLLSQFHPSLFSFLSLSLFLFLSFSFALFLFLSRSFFLSFVCFPVHQFLYLSLSLLVGIIQRQILHSRILDCPRLRLITTIPQEGWLPPSMVEYMHKSYTYMYNFI